MKKENKIKIFLLIALVLIIIVNAWLCDDAYISFRVVKNFVNGYGLRWNIFERVQVFTNPLQVLTLIPFYFVTREIYYTSLFFNIITSSIALYILIFKIAKSDFNAIFVTIILMISKSFIGFATSGLENSLTFLLLSIFFYFFLKKDEFNKKDILTLSFVSSLILLNRMDSILLVIPSFFFILKKREKSINFFKFCLYFIIGMIPFIAWELFALIYYGFLFPNTFYAKLSTGISKIDYIKNGITYLGVILRLDPATSIPIMIVLLFAYLSVNKKLYFLLAGIFLSVIYIVTVGGDFMLGRFLTPALFTTIILFAVLEKDVFKEKIIKYTIAISFLTFAILTVTYPLKNEFRFMEDVANEQAFYFKATSLMKIGSEKLIAGSNYYGKKADAYIIGNIGFAGYFAKDETKIIDPLALSDPFLARIPLKNPYLNRIGHISRDIPGGYVETVGQNKNLIQDKNLKEYYEIIKTITQDEIFSKKRIKTIINYHLGKYDYLIDNYLKGKES